MARNSSPAERSVVSQSPIAVESQASELLPVELRKLTTATERLVFGWEATLHIPAPNPATKLSATANAVTFAEPTRAEGHHRLCGEVEVTSGMLVVVAESTAESELSTNDSPEFGVGRDVASHLAFDTGSMI